MLDIRRFRHEPEDLKRALARRGDPELPGVVDEVGSLDEARRAAIGEVNELKARRNEASKQIGEIKRSGGDAQELIAAMRALGERIAELDEAVRANEARVEEILLSVPNLPLDEVPEGGEEANRVVATWGEPRAFAFEPKPHWELGEMLGILDLPRGSKISGLEDQRIRLSRAARWRRQAPARTDRLVSGRAHVGARIPGATRALPGHA